MDEKSVNERWLKNNKVNFESANFGKLFTHLKFVGLTQVMSQIEAMIKKGIYKWCLATKKFLLARHRKKIAGGHMPPPPVVRGLKG